MAVKDIIKPSLFGIKDSNRDFNEEGSWGKNVFNSAFPAALCCYFEEKKLEPNYLMMNEDGEYCIKECSVEKVFGISSKDAEIFYSFESIHTPYQPHTIGNLPRTDLVLQRQSDGSCLRGLEVKLTALPDNSTCDLTDSEYSSELVVRPDSIVYLACYLIESMGKELDKYLTVRQDDIIDWTQPSSVLDKTHQILKALESISKNMYSEQLPFLIQPIWKTEGKSPRLSDNCLDIFVWSDAGFLWFITQIANPRGTPASITRPLRAAVWLYKMLLDYVVNGKFDHKKIIDGLSYNTKNDKAFSANGRITYPFLKCANLEKPRIARDDIKSIILGGGQNLLSPERRFDAIIYNSPELFE